jgi:hypothetical protein
MMDIERDEPLFSITELLRVVTGHRGNESALTANMVHQWMHRGLIELSSAPGRGRAARYNVMDVIQVAVVYELVRQRIFVNAAKAVWQAIKARIDKGSIGSERNSLVIIQLNYSEKIEVTFQIEADFTIRDLSHEGRYAGSIGHIIPVGADAPFVHVIFRVDQLIDRLDGDMQSLLEARDDDGEELEIVEIPPDQS